MKLPFIALSFILMACSSGKPTAVDKTHVAQHGGTLLKGKDHYIEVVATERTLKIYPLQEAAGELTALPVESVKADAKYSMVRSKSDWSVDLDKKEDALVGDIDAKGEKEITVKLDLKIDGQKESYFHDVPVQ